MAAELPPEDAAVHAGHLDVEQDGVRAKFQRDGQRAGGIVHLAHLRAERGGQGEPDHPGGFRLVVHRQDALAREDAGRRGRGMDQAREMGKTGVREGDMGVADLLRASGVPGGR